MHLFFVAGELSGDTHGAGLLKALQELAPAGGTSGDSPTLRLEGLGGARMRGVSEAIEDWLDEAAVLGLWEVLKKYGYFKRRLDQTTERLLAEKPDAVVLIDYPGFNLRLADRLRQGGYQGKLIFYISPQVWAWKKGRIPRMARLLDRMICIFPFEKPLYEASGLPTDFAGHPLVDELAEERRADLPREENLVALLPGSRLREVEALFPAMVDAARRLADERPGLRFAMAPASAALEKRMRELTTAVGFEKVEVEEAGVHALMQRATVGVVASGTATLEAAFFGLPYCLVYRVAWPTYVVGRALVRIDWLGIVNILAGREVVKELLQADASPSAIADELARLLDDPAVRETLQSDLADVVGALGGGGAHREAARSVLATLAPES